jgi:arylsulfatase A-like enzyme
VRRLGPVAPLALLLLLLPSCRAVAPGGRPEGGPIVLITFDSLRADAVSGELTPNLDALLRQADWAGRAIAPSALSAPAMASLFTGLRPWQHQVLQATDRLSPALFTLPEALQAAGYETAGFTDEPMFSKDGGYDQGFDRLEGLGKGIEAARRLETLGNGGPGGKRRFVWIHLPEPAAPYLHHPRFDDRIGAGGLDLPDRIQPKDLALYADPAHPLPPARRRLFQAMYRSNVAWADDRLGRLLAALRASGEWDRTLLLVTSTHGEDLGETGRILSGGDLGRPLLEVPFAVKLPRGSRLRVVEPKERRVAAARLWATLVEAAGGEAPPAAAPSLFRRAPQAVLSELYPAGGAKRLSLVDGDDQLLWESRVAPPLAGREAPRLALARWEPGGGSRPVEDGRRTAELARLLARTWSAFVPAGRPPGEEAREWYTAESP